MPTKEFDDFVKRMNSAQETFDWAPKLDAWRKSLGALYASIGEFMRPQIDAGLVSLRANQITVREEAVGEYQAPALEIRIGREVVQVTPIGFTVIGAYGRVDVIGRAGESRLVLLDKSYGAPTSSQDKRAEKSRQELLQGMLDGVWYIATPPPGVALVELSRDRFLEALIAVADA